MKPFVCSKQELVQLEQTKLNNHARNAPFGIFSIYVEQRRRRFSFGGGLLSTKKAQKRPENRHGAMVPFCPFWNLIFEQQ